MLNLPLVPLHPNTPFTQNSESDQQRIWIQQELIRHPPAPDQEPFSWLLWRSKIAEGMSEKDAWTWVVQESNRTAEVQPAGNIVAQPVGVKQEVKQEEVVKGEYNQPGQMEGVQGKF